MVGFTATVTPAADGADAAAARLDGDDVMAELAVYVEGLQIALTDVSEAYADAESSYFSVPEYPATWPRAAETLRTETAVLTKSYDRLMAELANGQSSDQEVRWRLARDIDRSAGDIADQIRQAFEATTAAAETVAETERWVPRIAASRRVLVSGTLALRHTRALLAFVDDAGRQLGMPDEATELPRMITIMEQWHEYAELLLSRDKGHAVDQPAEEEPLSPRASRDLNLNALLAAGAGATVDCRLRTQGPRLVVIGDQQGGVAAYCDVDVTITLGNGSSSILSSLTVTGAPPECMDFIRDELTAIVQGHGWVPYVEFARSEPTAGTGSKEVQWKGLPRRFTEFWYDPEWLEHRGTLRQHRPTLTDALDFLQAADDFKSQPTNLKARKIVAQHLPALDLPAVIISTMKKQVPGRWRSGARVSPRVFDPAVALLLPALEREYATFYAATMQRHGHHYVP
jgi:hypothetical protein